MKTRLFFFLLGLFVGFGSFAFSAPPVNYWTPPALVKSRNLSDLPSASTARTNLGLAIGTNVEAWSANLDSWSAKTPFAGSLAIVTGKTATISNTVTLSGTDGSTIAFGAGGTICYLAGCTFTGAVVMPIFSGLYTTANDQFWSICGGNAVGTGGCITYYGANHASHGGQVNLGGAVYGDSVGLQFPLTTWANNQTCAAGHIQMDASYIYVCTASNTVKRVALSTF